MEKSIFKIIATYQYTSEAIIFKGKLESEGIEVFMRDNNAVDTNPLYSNAVGGVKLFVKSEDFYIEILFFPKLVNIHWMKIMNLSNVQNAVANR